MNKNLCAAQLNETGNGHFNTSNYRRLLSRDEIEAEYGISRRWLELAAISGEGPPFIKVSPRMVRYRRDHIEVWLNAREISHTAEGSAPFKKTGRAEQGVSPEASTLPPKS